jgi:hypothetical protein
VRDKTQTNSAEPGDRLIRAGAIVFFLGALATLVTVAPLFLHAKPFPTYMFGLSMLMGVGFLMAGAGVLQSMAAGRRQAPPLSASLERGDPHAGR